MVLGIAVNLLLAAAFCGASAGLGYLLGGKRRAVRFLMPVLGFILSVAAFWVVALLISWKSHPEIDLGIDLANNAARLAIFVGIAGGVAGFFLGDYVAGRLFGPPPRPGKRPGNSPTFEPRPRDGA
jgi:hypothetical protein